MISALSGAASFAIVYGLAGLPDGTGRNVGGVEGLGELEAKTTCTVTDYRSLSSGVEIRLGGRWIQFGDEAALDRIPHAAGHAIICARPRSAAAVSL